MGLEWQKSKVGLDWRSKKLIKNLVDGKFKCEVSNNVKIAAARRLNVSRKEKNRLNAELALQTEGLEELQLDILTMENINEGEFPVVSSDSNFLEETELKLRDIVKGILVNIKKTNSYSRFDCCFKQNI